MLKTSQDWKRGEDRKEEGRAGEGRGFFSCSTAHTNEPSRKQNSSGNSWPLGAPDVAKALQK